MVPYSIIIMIKTINLHNVEKLIFEDSELRKKLTSHKDLFHTWALSKQSPDFKAMGQKAILNFLNLITDQEIKIISEYFNEVVSVEKILTNVVEQYNCLINEAEKMLNTETIIKEAFFVYREGEQFYLSTWR